MDMINAMELYISDLKKECNRLYDEKPQSNNENVKFREENEKLKKELEKVRKYNAQLVAAARQEEIQIGDEVKYIDPDTGNETMVVRFFVTEYEKDSYIGGIDTEGNTHFHSDDDDMQCWKWTGRHVDMDKVLKILEDACDD